MEGYGQFCPVAKAAEVLDQRWTLLVLRELLLGSQHFNEIRRGVPKMSPTLLSRRLRDLVRIGVVAHTPDGRYVLTPAGAELTDVIEGLGRWGTRWMPELGDPDLDPHLLMWDVRRRVDMASLPTGRTVVHIVLDDLPRGAGREWWLVMTRDGTDVCDFDPGYDVAVRIDSDLRTMTRIWRGDVSWNAALAAGSLQVSGAERNRRALRRWLQLSAFATVPRPTATSVPARTLEAAAVPVG
jgi:DNA-binding HxlR family transcriptional regulator